MIIKKHSTVYWKQESGSRFGIGDFVVQLPGIDYLINDLHCQVHYFATEKFKCLLPKHDRLHVHDYPEDSPPSILPKWGWNTSYNYSHMSASWLPYLDRFERNFFYFKDKAKFSYPHIKYDKKLAEVISKKLGIAGRKYFTYVKMTSSLERNWTESGWKKLLDVLTEDYIGINVGLQNNSKNFSTSILNDNTIQLDDSLNLLEITHLIRGGEFHIAPDTGMYHLATAIGLSKVFVLWHPCNTDFEWVYPRNIKIYKEQPDDFVIRDILTYL
jgi:hypothetical protein